MATGTYETVPEELRSRLLSATTASFLTITPLGGLAAGFAMESEMDSMSSPGVSKTGDQSPPC
jgi:hypothetical protein